MILLDTCTLLWLVTNRAELSAAAAQAIDTAVQVFVSAASAFEIGTKYRQRKLPLPMSPLDWWTSALGRLQLVELSITPLVAFAATALPLEIVVGGRNVEHRDPGDRFIVATGSVHGLTIVTPDPKIAAFPNTTVVW
jgi:PIN domain nuclease of toxin-antitoxin system